MSFAGSFLRILQRKYSTAKNFSTATKVKDKQVNQVCSFRTIENNPVNHTTDHLNKLYTMPMEIQQHLFQFGGFPKKFVTQAITFQEYAILVRQPAVEIISYLAQADYSRPVNKYVLCILFWKKWSYFYNSKFMRYIFFNLLFHLL